MNKSAYESPLSSRYASDRMQYIFSPDKKFSTWRRLWIALARAEMELGLPITQEQIEEMEAHITDIDYELAARKESRLTREEIEEFTCRLKDFGLSLGDVADSCPRQERTMDACMQALDYARENPLLLQVLEREKKLPLSRLALGAGVEKKTLERHRNYLVAILLAYTNGYEIIRGHLSRIHRRENP